MAIGTLRKIFVETDYYQHLHQHVYWLENTN